MQNISLTPKCYAVGSYKYHALTQTSCNYVCKEDYHTSQSSYEKQVVENIVLEYK